MGEVVNMMAQKRLIREAREARAKRKAERKSAADRLVEHLTPHRLADGSYLLPGGIDDMEV